MGPVVLVVGLVIGVRFLANALIGRVAVGLRGKRMWSGAGTLLGADVVVVGWSMLLAFAGSTAKAAGHFRHSLSLGLIVTAAGFVVALLIWEAAVKRSARPATVSRQRVGMAAAAMLLTALMIGAGAITPFYFRSTRDSHRPAEITHYVVRVADLPPAFEGLRVCCVSDLHIGRHADADVVRARLRSLASVKADLILFLGDYATTWPRDEPKAAEIIAKQHAPMGVYAVLGNHDRWLGETRSLRALRDAGVHVLVNEHIALGRGGQKLYLAGVNDPYTLADDLDAALAGVPRGASVLLMSHTPDIIAAAPKRGIGLVVAGHTHGGQVVLPLIGPLVVASRYGTKYAHGLFREGGTAMFVTRGVGEVYPGLRFNCPREIAVVELRRK